MDVKAEAERLRLNIAGVNTEQVLSGMSAEEYNSKIDAVILQSYEEVCKAQREDDIEEYNDKGYIDSKCPLLTDKLNK